MSGKPSMSATRAKYRYRRFACDSPANASLRLSKLLVPLRFAMAPPLTGEGKATARPAARGAASVVLGTMIEDFEAGARREPARRARLRARRHVVDPPARQTREVVVRAGVAVEPHAGLVGALGQEPLGRQHPEIAVDRRQAHARQAAADAPVHEGGGRMGVGRADDVEDDPARPRQPEPAVAQRVDRFIVRNHYQLVPEAQSTHGAGLVS